MTDWQKEALALADFALLRFRYFSMADLDDLTDRLHKLLHAVRSDDEHKAAIQVKMIKGIIEES